MASATYAISSFLGGEVSQSGQGRFDKPDYKTCLNVCFNAFPTESGPWTRRPGTRFAGTTRAGVPGRVIKFDFAQSNAITIELTDGWARFWKGPDLVISNQPQVVVAVSAANPAVVQTTSAVTWATGDTLIFPGASTALLENRQFVATKIDTTHFALADAITGASIDGSTLGALVAGATVAKVHERATPYIGGSWANIRAVQAEQTDVLLAPGVPPQAIIATTAPNASPSFTISPVTFNDGPYLDPFTNGVQAVPGSQSGFVALTLSFPDYDSTKAYPVGAFITTSSVNYKSLQDQNVGNNPSTSPLFWAPTSASAAINNGQGFLGSDIGRLVRLLSEPTVWVAATGYLAKDIVSYNASGLPGGALYYQAAGSSTGIVPGSTLDGTDWSLIPSGAAIWTWGRITSLANIIDRALSGSANFGNMTSGGGVAAAFDGAFSKAAGSCAELGISGSGATSGQIFTVASYVGKNYSGAAGGGQKIQQAVIYPSTNTGFVLASVQGPGSVTFGLTFNLRGKASAPSSASDGTLLGTTGNIANGFSAITITSSDQVTAWPYVWIEQISTMQAFGFFQITTWSLTNVISQLSFFNPPGTGSTSAGINVEILGPPLLYTTPIQTWRLGAYSNTTGWPTCGCYDGGRLWLGGAIDNRFDASVSNAIVPGSSVVSFAPTDQFGFVAANAAIAETINSDSANPIRWMEPELQGVIMGTQAGEFLVLAPTSGPIAANNISVRRVTRIGGANIAPVRTEHTLAFVQRFARKLMEYFSDVYSGKFTAPNIADKADHIVRDSLAELAYVSAVTPVIWGRTGAGGLFGITYKRDTLTTSTGPTFYGWHRHGLGSGRLVESLCTGPSTGGDLDALTLVTNDPATSVRHVEILTDAMDEVSPLAESWFLDDAVNPTSTAQVAPTTDFPYGGLTLNGLWHLNGKTAQVFAGGLDLGDRGPGITGFTDFTVTNGSIFVPYGDSLSAGPGRGLFTAAFVAGIPVSEIVVGLTYDSDGQLLRPISPADSGSRTGPSLGAIRRTHRSGALLLNTLGISFGTSFNKMIPARFTLADGVTNIPPLTTYSGVQPSDIFDQYSYDSMICWRISRPLPATVVAIFGNLQAQDQ